MSRKMNCQEMRLLATFLIYQRDGYRIDVRAKRAMARLSGSGWRDNGGRVDRQCWKRRRRSQYWITIDGKRRKKWLMGFGPDPPVEGYGLIDYGVLAEMV